MRDMPNPLFALPLYADRWTMFRSPPLAFLDEDLTSAVFKMQVRDKWNSATAPFANLVTVTTAAAEGVRLIYSGTATVAAHMAALRLDEVPPDYLPTDNLLLSLVGIRINKSTMNAFPFEDGDRSADVPCVYDLWITPSGGDEVRRLYGPFIAEAGSTQ